MRRYLRMIFILFVAVSCGVVPVSNFHPTPTPQSTSQPIISSTALPSYTTTPSLTPSPLPTASPSPSLTPTPTGPTFTVLYHPDDVLYVGDQVSFEVIAPPGVDVKGSSASVKIDPPSAYQLGPVEFGGWGIAGRQEAAMVWAWDTKSLAPGTHTLSFDVEPQGYTWTEQVTLLPASAMPADQAAAHWSTTQSQCCTVYYITNTASQRDISALSTTIDAQAQDAIQKMGANFTEPITITLLSRLLGNGGFTSTEISVSYLDRNYASNSWELVVHHEMIHAIDGHLGGDFKPTMFVEGLAVYLTGGHYKPEPLMPRAAALLPGYLNLYIPLQTLADNFYASQHEIGYLEGASLIEYMVNTYGWEAFSTFYRNIHNRQGESQSSSIDNALQAHFSITFSQLEQNFLAALKIEPNTSSWVNDVRFEVDYYNTMRRYQQLLDPSAYFATAWLLDNKSMRERGIVADYLRHPHTPTNLALETMLMSAHQQSADLDYASAGQSLVEINSVMDAIERGMTDPFSVSPVAAGYLTISDTLLQKGYEVQSLTIVGDTASAQVTTSAGPALIPVDLLQSAGQWSIIP